MAMAHPVNWFEIPVHDLARAKNFYTAVFGREISDLPMPGLEYAVFPMHPGEAGSTGALVKAEHYIPSHAGTMVYFEVEDIEATLAKIGENGGKTLMGKSSIGQYGFIAHFEDSEGNRVALHGMY